MSKPICCLCEVELKPKQCGIIVAEMFQDDKEIYRLWNADIWYCPVCGFEVVVKFADKPLMEHFDCLEDGKRCREVLSEHIIKGGRVVYNKERG